jgi:hypothetical protein
MRPAIVTKYIGPSNHRGGRVKASADKSSVTIPWDHAISPLQNHAEAARSLALKLEWTGKFVMANYKHGYSFVCAAAESYGFVLEGTDVNGEGLTFEEWSAAADREDNADSRAAWQAGEDPTEHRAERLRRTMRHTKGRGTY